MISDDLRQALVASDAAIERFAVSVSQASAEHEERAIMNKRGHPLSTSTPIMETLEHKGVVRRHQRMNEEAKRGRGRPPSAETSAPVMVWLPSSAHDRLIQLARREERSISSVVRSLLMLQLR